MASFGRAELNSSLRDLFVSQIEDLYDAETRITKTLPKMADAAASGALRQAFEYHLAETEGHVSRLERIFRQVKIEPKRKTRQAMKGLIAEGEEMIGATGDSDVRDAVLIAAARLVGHYEMASYGTALTIARQLGLVEATSLLQQSLNEKTAADLELTQIAASTANVRANVKRAAASTRAADEAGTAVFVFTLQTKASPESTLSWQLLRSSLGQTPADRSR
jgi:ferritin-like metal-binding protein YciE